MSQVRNKVGVSYRLSPNAIALIAGLTNKLGVSQAAVMEMAIRKLAIQEGVSIDVPIDSEEGIRRTDADG